MRYFKNYSNWSVLILSSLICGYAAILMGKEITWDICNYHYYNVYAFLHAGDRADYWPSSFLHQYLNPILDIPSYLLINFFNDYAVVFLQGTLHGVAFFLLYLISKSFVDKNHPKEVALFIAFMGICSPIILSILGSFANDIIISIFVLLSVLAITHFLQHQDKENKSLFFLGSVSLGIAIGLKYTAGCYFVGAFLALCFLSLNIKKRLLLLSLLSSGVGTGVLISAGHWMLFMWQQHHNPLFPYFNNFFLSPEFASDHLRDTRFLPKSLMEQLFFPFIFSFNGIRIIESDFRDFRFVILYVLFALYFISLKFIKEINPAKNWLFLFFLVSYITWQVYFSIGRYLMPVEFLAPLIIYLLLLNLITQPARNLMMTILVFSFLLSSFIPRDTARIAYNGDSFFNTSIPAKIKTIQHTQILVGFAQRWDSGDPRPLTHLIPFFPKHFQFIGIPYSGNIPVLAGHPQKKVEQLLALNPYTQKFVLSGLRNIVSLIGVAKELGYKNLGECLWIQDDRQFISKQKVYLCKVS